MCLAWGCASSSWFGVQFTVQLSDPVAVSIISSWYHKFIIPLCMISGYICKSACWWVNLNSSLSLFYHLICKICTRCCYHIASLECGCKKRMDWTQYNYIKILLLYGQLLTESSTCTKWQFIDLRCDHPWHNWKISSVYYSITLWLAGICCSTCTVFFYDCHFSWQVLSYCR